MKKLIIAAFAVAFAAIAQAASVDWKFTASESEIGQKVYILTSAVETHYDNINQLIVNSISEGTIEEYTSRGQTTYRTDTSITATSSSLTDSVYVVLVSANDATEYKYGTANIASHIYNPDAQESSKGVIEFTVATLTKTGTIGEPSSVPEPTSALMLLVGLAGLALKRKVA